MTRGGCASTPGEKQGHRREIAPHDRIVQGRPVVVAALLHIGAGIQKQGHDCVLVRPVRGQGFDQRRETVLGRVVRVGAKLQQDLDERQRAPGDRVFQRMIPHRQIKGQQTVGEALRVAQRFLQGVEIAAAIGAVNGRELPIKRAPVRRHVAPPLLSERVNSIARNDRRRAARCR